MKEKKGKRDTYKNSRIPSNIIDPMELFIDDDEEFCNLEKDLENFSEESKEEIKNLEENKNKIRKSREYKKKIEEEKPLYFSKRKYNGDSPEIEQKNEKLVKIIFYFFSLFIFFLKESLLNEISKKKDYPYIAKDEEKKIKAFAVNK